jgi:hypothetical protein
MSCSFSPLHMHGGSPASARTSWRVFPDQPCSGVFESEMDFFNGLRTQILPLIFNKTDRRSEKKVLWRDFNSQQGDVRHRGTARRFGTCSSFGFNQWQKIRSEKMERGESKSWSTTLFLQGSWTHVADRHQEIPHSPDTDLSILPWSCHCRFKIP